MSRQAGPDRDQAAEHAPGDRPGSGQSAIGGAEGVDPAFRSHISYIDRSRDYYRSKGYTVPYRWIKHRSAPFTPLTVPLPEARVGVVTTSFPHASFDGRPKAALAAPCSPAPPSMVTEHLFWHKQATHTDDVESFLPLQTLRRLESEGRIGTLSPRFYSVPTMYSHRRTRDAVTQIVDFCREDELDAAVLVPI